MKPLVIPAVSRQALSRETAGMTDKLTAGMTVWCHVEKVKFPAVRSAHSFKMTRHGVGRSP